jgi:hypothetical protein
MNRTHRITVGDGALAYREWGSGEPMLLLLLEIVKDFAASRHRILHDLCSHSERVKMSAISASLNSVGFPRVLLAFWVAETTAVISP